MEKRIYRNPSVMDNDFAAEDVSLQVNCTGHTRYERAYTIHSVRSDYYLLLLRAGTRFIDSPVNGGKSIRESGFIIFDKDLPFAYHGEIGMEYRWVHFGGRDVPDILSSCSIVPGTVYPIGENTQLDLQFDVLFDAFFLRDTLFDTDTAQKLCAILVTLGREITRGTADENVPSPLRDTLQYIHEHYAEPLSVQQLASRQYMSISHFRDLFHKTVHQSPQTYIQNLRLQQACMLLQTSNLPVYAIAGSVGYSDSHYFSRLFLRKMNMTPIEYRTSGRQQ